MAAGSKIDDDGRRAMLGGRSYAPRPVDHTIYLLGGKRIPVARHAEIDDGLAEKMFRECEEVRGRGWWR